MNYLRFFLILLFFTPALSTAQTIHSYTVPEKPWKESFGNHRAVLEVGRDAEWVDLEINWRRHDPNPEIREFIIIEAATGDTVKNIHRITVNKEICQLSFGPVDKAGQYYFYYLPYVVQEGWGFYHYGYLKPKTHDMGLKEQGSGVKAKVLSIQARTLFDSFYPMEVIALESEKDSLLENYKEPYLLFPEDRKFPIRMKDDIPHKWIQTGPSNSFHGKAMRNEYYVFQIGVFAARSDVENLSVEFQQDSSQAGEGSIIDNLHFTCFNTAGVDPYGTPFTKHLSLKQGGVQALWIGVDIPENTEAGTYSSEIIIKARGFEDQTVACHIEINNEIISDRGDAETWRHSRLRWLNSTAGLDDEPVKPYSRISKSTKNTWNTSGTKIEFAPSGLPAMIATQTNILANPVSFIFDSGDKIFSFTHPGGELTKENSGRAEWKHNWNNQALDVNVYSSLEFDGHQNYRLSLNIKEHITLKDIRLEIPFLPETASYMMGMSLPGCETPDDHTSKWNKPEDSFWVGNARGGLWCEIRGSSYHGPLQNLYKPGPPEPWNNDGKGYLSLKKFPNKTLATAGTGALELYPGEKWVFEFALLPTPVKALSTADQFTNRYYHSGGAPAGVEAEMKHGIKIVNIHHANQYNPYINYPFIAVNELRGIVDQYHDVGLKVKIYYTIRELSNHVTEIWALRSLDDEILGGGRGGGYPWLREHFVTDYTPQWYQHFESGSPDASVLTSTQSSRWFNYYIEGLGWLVRNMDIDGLYLDDVSFDRRILKRMRKVMEAEKPGCLIDLHSNTGFSKGPAIQYTDFFPYVDKLWFGESFQYNKMPPDNWFVEVSGIPFGLMGDMLHGGGNRWLGMLFGMTVRLPWTSEGNSANPRPVWGFWDEFEIDKAVMIGFWEDCPVNALGTDQKISKNVKISLYKKSNSAILAIGNFSDKCEEVSLQIDWDTLGLDPKAVRIYAPAIQDFQPIKNFSLHDKIIVPAREGWLIIIK